MEPTPERFDVIVIGGGAAGLAAALQLARARRSVAVVDAGEPRNAPAAHMHSYLGHDGRPPAEFLAIGRREVEGYGATLVRGRVESVTGDVGEGFVACLDDGRLLSGRRIVLAAGVVDELPDVDGVGEHWGRGVIHCPFCHGWEVRDQRVVLIASHSSAPHVAGLFHRLTDELTVVVHDATVVERNAFAALERHGVPVVDGPAAEVVGRGDAVIGVRLGNGTTLPADAVVVATRVTARAGALAPLGVEMTTNPMGDFVATDDMRQTTVAGVYAVGNAADGSLQVLHAAADGSRVGAWITSELAAADLT